MRRALAVVLMVARDTGARGWRPHASGERGTVAIAGHRTTYGAPLRHIDRLRRGDRIAVTMPYRAFRYAVEGTRIVAPGEVSVRCAVGHRRLVLSACHPLFSAARRIVVYAAPVRVGRTARALKREAHGAR
jgi:LPXTG-site transpeptidase (sortase) family protein